MKKIAVILMVAILSSILVIGASAAFTPITIAKTTTPPTLDGVISEGEWGEPVSDLKTFEEVRAHAFSWIPETWPEYAELYGNVMEDKQLMPSAITTYMTWDDDFFYFGIKIVVETRCAPDYTKVWQKDCVYFNAMDDPYEWNTGLGYFACTFSVHDDGDLIFNDGEAGAARNGYDINPTTTDAEWVGIRDEAKKTTTYEFKFYWDEMISKATTQQMKEGDMFGINLVVSPSNYDGDPYGIIDITPAGSGPHSSGVDHQYNFAVTLGGVGASVNTPAETEAPAETTAPAETEAPAAPVEVAAPSSWAAEEVNAAIAAGLVPAELQKNYTDGISRADLSKMLGVLIDKVYGQEPATSDAAFTDTTDAAVLKAANLGIINGYKQDDGTFMFKPANTLKRSEMSAIINRVAKLCGEETTGFDAEVKFVDTVDHWCNSELGYPVHMGIVKGTSETTFSPENTLTVEQTIMMIYRTFTALQK